MKPVKYIGVALVAAAALGTVACNNGSTSAPDFNSVYSSAVVTQNPQSSSSEIALNLSSSEQNITQSSSSVNALSSSSKMELCKHVTDVLCEPCPPGEKCSCHPCDVSKEGVSYDCRTGEELHCEDGEWLTPEQFCPDGRWTTLCNGRHYYDPVCCTEKETCVEVYGKVCAPCMEGYKCPCNPCEKENAEAIDCSTGEKLVCKDGEWGFNYEMSSSSVAPSSSSVQQKCRDFVNMCPPCDSVHGCDLTNVPCNQCNSRTDSIALDCETGATYVCQNNLWNPAVDSSETCTHITEFNGTTSFDLCVNQNGRSTVDCVTKGNYQCKDNRWQKVACLNIKPDECKPGMGGCGYRLCQPDGIREIADCENSVVYACDGEKWVEKKTTGNQRCARGELEYCDACFKEGKFEGHYKCEGGKWRKMGMGDETCDALIPECGYSEYDLCMKHNLTEYCNGKWLDEPCDTDSSRDLVVYENGKKLTNRGGNYICVNGKWIERFRYYECGEKEDCVPESVRCQASPAIGTACNNEGVPAEFDGCTLICSGGAYLYAPPPTW